MPFLYCSLVSPQEVCVPKVKDQCVKVSHWRQKVFLVSHVAVRDRALVTHKWVVTLSLRPLSGLRVEVSVQQDRFDFGKVRLGRTRTGRDFPGGTIWHRSRDIFLLQRLRHWDIVDIVASLKVWKIICPNEGSGIHWPFLWISQVPNHAGQHYKDNQ